MKIIEEVQEFQPVTLVIESLEELEWIYACSNSSVTGAKANFQCIAQKDFTSEKPHTQQADFYRAMQAAYTRATANKVA